MTKLMRKYQKWLMVVFGILLMLAFLGGPAINEVSRMQRDRVIGRIDDSPVRAGEWAAAASEVAAFNDLARRGFPAFSIGIEEGAGEIHHWLLLSREAKAAGLVAEPRNGEEYLDTLGSVLLQQLLQRDFSLQFQLQMEKDPAKRQAMIDSFRGQLIGMVRSTLASSRLNQQESGAAIAKLMAVHLLQSEYLTAPRVSSRVALLEAKEKMDAAVGDAVIIPASKLAEQVPAPTPEQLQAHFEKYKATKPGEGEFGIGYFLPARVKLEYLKLSREGIENAVQPDPVEVTKRYRQDRAKYPGEIAVERPRIEAEIRREKADSIMREAQGVIQREVQKASRRLATSGRFKVLPPDWEQQRPQFGAIAQAVVDGVRASTGTTIPTPEVEVRTDAWLTQQDLASLPGIGQSMLMQGNLQIPFPDIAFWTKELGGAGPLPIQAAVPVVDTFLQDFESNRYFFTILSTRGESAPDSVAEIADKASQDFRSLVAFEQLTSRLTEIAATATTAGLASVVDQFNLRPAPAPQGSPPPADPVRTDVRITRASGGMDPALQEEHIRGQIMDAADKIDPLLPPDQIPAQAATLAIPAPKHLSVVVFRIRRVEPLTVEMVQNEQVDANITGGLLAEQMRDRTRQAFSLEALLKRHAYYTGKTRIESAEQLRSDQEG
jgi:hypothetical protein